MKIGFDAKRAFLNSSGLGNYGRNTLQALQDFYPENQYVLFTPKPDNSRFYKASAFNVVSPVNPFLRIINPLWRSVLLSSQLKKHKLDIYHGLSNELPFGIAKSGIPSVVTIHDLIFLRFPQYYPVTDRLIYFKKTKYACEKATKIIAISNQTKNDIIHYLNVDPEKIEVVYQSVDSEYFESADPVFLKTKYRLPENFFLSVGTLEPRKNQLAILKAIQSYGKDLNVVFVGRMGSNSKIIMNFVSKNGMENQVRFLSDIPVKDLAGLYRLSAFSVYISSYEGFGLPVVESMASGCPVIVSDKSVLPETAGGAALICDPDDLDSLCQSMELLLNDENRRRNLILKGSAHAQQFHPERFSQKMILLYSRIIST